MVHIDKQKFLLTHEDSGLFHRSEWDRSKHGPSTAYTAYRIVMALFMSTGIALHFVSTLDTLGIKWFIYMTNQGIGFLTLHYLIYAGIVVGRRMSPHDLPASSFPMLYSVSWGMQTCFTTVALWISIIYWGVLHSYVIEFGLMKGTWMEILNVFLHGLNTVSCLIDIMVTARPIYIHHSYLPIIFGVYYTLFSLVYWAAGGVGICMRRCPGSSDSANDPTCPMVCDKYIYPILDWEDHPGLAAGVVAGGCLLMPVLVAFWWGLVRLRMWIKEKTT